MDNIMVTEKYEMHIVHVSERWQIMRIRSGVNFGLVACPRFCSSVSKNIVANCKFVTLSSLSYHCTARVTTGSGTLYPKPKQLPTFSH